jgi:hypothetical protein
MENNDEAASVWKCKQCGSEVPIRCGGFVGGDPPKSLGGRIEDLLAECKECGALNNFDPE